MIQPDSPFEIYTIARSTWGDVKYHSDLLHFRDVGIGDKIAHVEIAEYSAVFEGEFFTVQILRLMTGYHDNKRVCLSQPLYHFDAPIMGYTAFASPYGPTLFEHERFICLAVFNAFYFDDDDDDDDDAAPEPFEPTDGKTLSLPQI